MRAYLVAVLLTSLMVGCGDGSYSSSSGPSSQQRAVISSSEFMSLPGSYKDYTVGQNGNSYVVTDKSGKATSVPGNIKRVTFSDGSIALDLNGNAGQVYRLYQAAFNRQPDLGGLSYWIDMMDKGQTIQAIADGFANSQEYKTLYGENPTNVQIITRYYNNVLHRQPEQGGFDYWVNILNTQLASRVGVLIEFSESPENQAQVLPAIGNGIVYASGDTTPLTSNGIRPDVETALKKSYGANPQLTAATLKLGQFYQTWFAKAGLTEAQAQALIVEELRISQCVKKAASSGEEARTAVAETKLRTFNTKVRMRQRADILSNAGGFILPANQLECTL